MRRNAREVAFKMIFSRLFTSQEIEGLTEELKSEEKTFAQEIFDSFMVNRESLTEKIGTNLIGYTIDRIYKVDLALLYLSITEIDYLNTPAPIAINEAVELAKKYSTEKSSRFINGVLSKIVK